MTYGVGVACGYFSVLHIGHLNYLKNAKKKCGYLIVVVNNNEQQIRKKGKLIQDAKDIKKIIESFKFVDKVIISKDKDQTQCKTLRKIHPDKFFKGGDSNRYNVPELQTCKEINCKVFFGVGGKKLNSSTNLLEKLEK